MPRFAYIIDDDPSVLISVRAMLKAAGNCIAVGFRTAEDFLDGIGEHEPGVLIVDHGLPGLDGLQLLERLRGSSRFISIMITAQGDVTLAVDAMKAGANDFVEKPYEPETLFAAIDACFALLEENRDRRARELAARDRIDALTEREREVLQMLVDGKVNKQIAHALGVSLRTVETHRANLLDKMDAPTFSDALRIAYRAGLTA